ncbi:MAG: putative hydrolase of the superfamily [Solirubrobacterales bacterium]|jgi:putative hydrolase of the HAD superfamily|nr:putative hydrolase of the superfamily [Solirubrobacterales bacterium]
MAIRCVICDFGGVLTTPLVGSFMAFQDQTGIPTEALGSAMARITERDGAHPLYELEKGHITEHDFLAQLRVELAVELGHEPELHDFKEIYFQALNPNDEMIAEMRAAKNAGFRMALLTNNVREWEPLWRSMLPVDEIFELVVDSAFVGMRKPEPEIYHLTLERIREHDPAELEDLEFSECLFIDDFEVNCAAARELGINAVRFASNDQALGEIRAALGTAAA